MLRLKFREIKTLKQQLSNFLELKQPFPFPSEQFISPNCFDTVHVALKLHQTASPGQTAFHMVKTNNSCDLAFSCTNSFAWQILRITAISHENEGDEIDDDFDGSSAV